MSVKFKYKCIDHRHANNRFPVIEQPAGNATESPIQLVQVDSLRVLEEN